MQRSGRIVVLAHCILNAHTKVKGLAAYQGALSNVVVPLVTAGVGIVQLPCPENTFLGINRWGMTREQYDVPAFRRHSRSLLEPLVDLLEDHAREGYEILGVVGVDGSPSCGVQCTCEGFKGGEAACPGVFERAARDLHMISGEGIFVRTLRKLFEERALKVPLLAVDERAPGCGAETLLPKLLAP